ncbi:ABC transporter permease subunit [Streptomyces sp. NPDC050743]|uniref:ABC transporter permease subunit n=1 Tax=Streptomyces sp. NPDC050743 TaxID=3365634 RepID=UPI00378D3287
MPIAQPRRALWCLVAALPSPDTAAEGFGADARGTVTVWARAATQESDQQMADAFNRTHHGLRIEVTAVPDAQFGLVLFSTTMNLPFGVFVMRNAFLTIPHEIEESARVDGASVPQMLVRVLWPLVLPVELSNLQQGVHGQVDFGAHCSGHNGRLSHGGRVRRRTSRVAPWPWEPTGPVRVPERGRWAGERCGTSGGPVPGLAAPGPAHRRQCPPCLTGRSRRRTDGRCRSSLSPAG